jgi:hypothetical protein
MSNHGTDRHTLRRADGDRRPPRRTGDAAGTTEAVVTEPGERAAAVLVVAG